MPPPALPVYVVGGWMRSGTSMLMAALHAGGMDAAYSPARDRERLDYADDFYDPNPAGLYELDQADYVKPGFPQGYEGRLVKCLRSGPARMAPVPGGIRVVYMLRDHEEQRQSATAFFAVTPPSVEDLAAETARNLHLIGRRPDIDLMTLDYADVLAAPHTTLGRVAAFYGTPLDVDAAASVVDPSQYRFRAADLTPGIL